MDEFRHADCVDVVAEGSEVRYALVSIRSSARVNDFRVKLVRIDGDDIRPLVLNTASENSLAEAFSQCFTPVKKVDSAGDPFFFDIQAIQRLIPCVGDSSSFCAITRTDHGWKVWKLLKSDGSDTIHIPRLILIVPDVLSFDVSISIERGPSAVCISAANDLKISPKITSTQRRSYPNDIRVYSPMSGWEPWSSNFSGADCSPTFVRCSSNGAFFVLIFRAVAGSECFVVHSQLGELWRGKSIRNETLSISDQTGFISWVGHARDVRRYNSAHPRMFLFSPLTGIRTVSPEGHLVISSGFLSLSDRAWFTIQRGVADLRTYFCGPESGSVEESSNPPIIGKSASDSVYKTESLSEYPSIVFLRDGVSTYPLPRNTAAEKLSCSEWHHWQRPSLQGIWYCMQPGLSNDTRPVLIHLHGGPAMPLLPFRRNLIESSDWLLPLIAKGKFDILSLAYSGSLGFGDQFSQSVIGHQGAEEIDDIIDAVNEIRASGRTVAGIFGGSYGGYLSLHAYCSPHAALRSIPRFAALYPYISSRGCAAETGDFAWEAEYTGVDSENVWPIPNECLQPDVLPHLYQADVTRPLMLFHGDSDNVCPLSQSKQTFNILRQRGAKDNVSLTVYKGESHGFRDPEIRSDCIERIISFFTGEESQ